MTADIRKARRGVTSATPTEPAAGPGTDRIVAVLDGSECTGRVIKYLLDWQRRRGTPELVFLLNVQPEPQDWRLRGYGWFQREAIEDRLINDLGRRIVASAAKQLDGAGVPHRDLVVLGEPADVIRRCVEEHGCNLVVLAEPRRGRLRRWLMAKAGIALGSVPCSLVHLTPASILVVGR